MEDLPIPDGPTIPGWELWFTAARAGGPGGQHVNTSSTAVTLHWNVGGTTALDDEQRRRVLRRLANRVNREGVLLVGAQDERSQKRNLDAARARLAALIAGALERPKRRVATRPTAGSKRRRLAAKRARGELKAQRSAPPPEE